MSEQSLKIAMALEKLVDKAIADFEFGLDVLHFPVPNSVRAQMWRSIVRRSIAKVMECEKL